MADRPLHFSTRAVTTGRPPAGPDAPLNAPVVLASTYGSFGDLEYGRYANPSWTAFEDALGDLEGGRCIAFASGMAAIAAVLDLVPTGGTVVAARHSYTGTIGRLRELEERGLVRTVLVDVTDTAAVAEAARGAALVWLESPTNPALELADIAAVVRGAHAVGALVAVDNTFATPLLQRPLEHGADLVVHSVTKGLAGHSDLLMGAVVTASEELATRVTGSRTLGGAVPSAFEAFLALRGLRTLPVRLERAQATAQRLVRRLEGHPGVHETRYPGFGSIVSVVLADAEAADALVHGVRLWRAATSLGGVESTLERRRRWAAEAPTIPEGLVRLSVGLEDPDDLWDDLEQALPAA
ncbi:trans-sulfuration enzyme family protein [Amnibacterium kyonggiense]|uniref:homocysteine desulfhydrase n=1 Tax=Amnibacterium kyonggiense TaxID=595671 RepID=A0A4R7FRT8_9MICO|nr:PLP-dependent aspartate aminotransferase family protein [Amnibacterium kyonggiense]TDS80530.1 cystathionine gamma-synthase [Amnibacterium kyonggiense]